MILAIASAGKDTELWLLGTEARDASAPLAHEQWESGRSLANGLLMHIHQLIIGRQADWSDLTGIVIYSGPGSFTSLRIAHTVVNTLVRNLNLPLASATSESWLTDALNKLGNAKPGEPVWPFYGGEANITPAKS